MVVLVWLLGLHLLVDTLVHTFVVVLQVHLWRTLVVGLLGSSALEVHVSHTRRRSLGAGNHAHLCSGLQRSLGSEGHGRSQSRTPFEVDLLPFSAVLALGRTCPSRISRQSRMGGLFDEIFGLAPSCYLVDFLAPSPLCKITKLI